MTEEWTGREVSIGRSGVERRDGVAGGLGVEGRDGVAGGVGVAD